MPVNIMLDTAELDRLIGATGGRIERFVADGVHYGIYQEMGVENGFGKGIHIPAHPFMSPAVEAVRPGWDESFRGQLTIRQVEGVVVKAAGNVERGAKERAPYKTHALQNSIHVQEGQP